MPTLLPALGISDESRYLTQCSTSTTLACCKVFPHICTLQHAEPPSSADTEKWFQRSLDALKQKFPKELEFVVLTPSFKTLRQQTFDRLLKAGLASADNTDLVVPCIWARKVRGVTVSHQVQPGSAQHRHPSPCWCCRCKMQ